MTGAVSVLDGLLDPLIRCLDEVSARRLLELRIEPKVQERVDFLAERANEGLLTDEERSEYEAIISADEFITILQLKVRARLQSGHE